MDLRNNKGKHDTISEALQLTVPDHAVISITGAGGKSSLIFAWAEELAAGGKRVVITTTTHMSDPDYQTEQERRTDIPVIFCPDIPETAVAAEDAEESETAEAGIYLNRLERVVEDHLNERGIVMVVSKDAERPGKVKMPPEQLMKMISELADVVMVEADGSRRNPVKWPAPWEPVIRDDTCITVCVAGLSALGKKISEVMYRAEHLPGSITARTNNTSPCLQTKGTEFFLDEELLCLVLTSPDGGLKGAKGEFRVFLNQADDDDLMASAARIQKGLEAHGIICAWGRLSF